MIQMVMPFWQFFLKEITTKCSIAYHDKDFKETIDAFVAGQLSTTSHISRLTIHAGKFEGLEKMVTSRIHIDDTPEKGFKELVNNKDHHIKILITPDKSKV